MSEYILCSKATAHSVLRQLLANLWARQAALQCCHNQESFDLLLPTYTFNGPIKDGDVFDPERLSGCCASIKLKTAGDLKAGNTLRPLGIPRSLTQPLPYIALHLELGCETTYRETQSKIVSHSSKPAPPGEFEGLVDE